MGINRASGCACVWLQCACVLCTFTRMPDSGMSFMSFGMPFRKVSGACLSGCEWGEKKVRWQQQGSATLVVLGVEEDKVCHEAGQHCARSLSMARGNV